MHKCSTTIPQHLPSSLPSDVNTICSIKIVLWGQEQMFIKLHRIALCRYCASPLNNLVSSAFVAQKDDILHFACQSDDCWGSEALFKINSQHNVAHTDPLSLGQDYETETEDYIHLKLLTGKGIKYRRVDVVERVWVVAHHKCWGLIGLHNLTIMLTGPGNLWISPRRPGLVHT